MSQTEHPIKSCTLKNLTTHIEVKDRIHNNSHRIEGNYYIIIGILSHASLLTLAHNVNRIHEF